ncbi:response regulator transcription factor [Paenibacillus methanolicus]|uniref:Two-component system response regulator YesN n=1 Tax=Paenibacillus methanolicus TaxID=582686 RepID=A0A5S5BXN4_9BACL|nr:response regulator [Paenibacillus methanolicus]TYP71066.1 two-component system response regulator YesN [Paenibacillus methanolicus]
MLRMLVADDDQNERDGIRYLIEKHRLPMEIKEAKNGRRALAILQEEPFDVLLTDIRMPFMDGLQLAQEARCLKPDLRIVILSGHGEFEYARRAITLQVKHYLLKPIEPEEFLDVMRVLAADYEQQQSLLQPVAQPVKRYAAPAGEDAVPSGVEEAHRKRAVHEVIRLIEQQFDRDLSLEQLARHVHLSGSYLSHIFKRTTGQSIVKYINQLRMEKARELLDQNNYKIVDVCRMVGFSDISYFGVMFKSHYGLTPAQYRERVRTS